MATKRQGSARNPSTKQTMREVKRDAYSSTTIQVNCNSINRLNFGGRQIFMVGVDGNRYVYMNVKTGATYKTYEEAKKAANAYAKTMMSHSEMVDAFVDYFADSTMDDMRKFI